MDPFTIAAFLYISGKIGEKLLDRGLEKGFDLLSESILPKAMYRERLRIVIEKTSAEYNNDRLDPKSKELPFHQSELLFTQLLESQIYNETENPLSQEVFSQNFNIIPPNKEDLDKFYNLFKKNIEDDKELQKLYVEEFHREAIFIIQNNIKKVDDKIDIILKNSKIEPQINLNKKHSSKSRFRFYYLQQMTQFLGRTDELVKLIDFFNSKEVFSWWVIIGKGGVGKSRLALELSLKLIKDGVNAGFLSFQEIISFHWSKWQPESPCLFIVDYAASNHQAVLNFIRTLSHRNDLKFPIRILLLERETNEWWWNDFMNDYIVANSSFKDIPLLLEGLTEESLVNIVEQIIEQENPEIRIGKEELGEIILNIDPQGRPLFAMFSALALANGQHIRDWSQDALLDFQLDHDEKLTNELYSNYDKQILYQHKNLAIVSTICYGITTDNLRKLFNLKKNWLPSNDTFDNDLYNSISNDSDINNNIFFYKNLATNLLTEKIEISPIFPDILGEYYVLKNLSTESRFRYRDQERLEFIKDFSIQNSYLNYIFFIRRILQDFPTHPMTLPLLKNNKSTIVNTRGSFGREIINMMQRIFPNNPKVLKILWNYTKELAEDEEKYPIKKVIIDYPHHVYQEATFLIIRLFCKELEEKLSYYQLMTKNTDYFQDKIPLLTTNPEEPFIEDIEKSRELLTNPQLAQEWIKENSAKDERIPYLEALTIKYLIEEGLNNNKMKLIEDLYDRLCTLSSKFSDPRIKLLLLDSIVKIGTGGINEIDNTIKNLYKEIKLTPRQVDPIDENFQKVLFLKKMLEYYRGENPRLVVDYYEDYLNTVESELKSKKYHNKYINCLIGMADLAQETFYFYFSTNNEEISNYFFASIYRIGSFFGNNIPPEILYISYQTGVIIANSIGFDTKIENNQS